MKEFGDKLPADKKAPIEEDTDEAESCTCTHRILQLLIQATAELNTVFQAASQEMYNAQAAGGAQADPNAGQQANAWR